MREALRKFGMVVAGVAVLGVLLVILYFIFWAGKISTDDAEVDAHLVSVSPRISGQVLKVLADDNQAVKKGDILAVLDPKDNQAKFAQAKARELLAEKQYLAAELNVPVTYASTTGAIAESAAQERAAQNAVNQAQANLEGAKARLRLASENYDRMKVLMKNYVISKRQMDSARAAYVEASQEVIAGAALLRQRVSQLAAAHGGVTAASGGPEAVREKRSQAQAARAQWRQAKADLALAGLELGYTVIRAPADGIVTEKQVEPGEVVSPGQQLLILSPVNRLWVTADFKETDLRNMRPGQKAEIRVDAYPDKIFKGTVDSVSGATGARTSLFPPENATGNYVKVVQRIPVKIAFSPKEDVSLLRAGMSVEATVFVR